jgi:hypothetical protein
MNNKTKKRNNTAKFSYLFLFDLRVNICKNHPYWNLGGKQIDSGPFFSDSSYKNRVPGKFSAQTDLSGPKYLDS